MDIPSTQNWKAMKTMSRKGISLGVSDRARFMYLLAWYYPAYHDRQKDFKLFVIFDSRCCGPVEGNQAPTTEHNRGMRATQFFDLHHSLPARINSVDLSKTLLRLSVTAREIADVTKRTCARRFNTTSSGSSDSSLFSPPTKRGIPGDLVGRGASVLVRGVAVDENELERGSVALVGVTVGIEEEVEVAGRLGDGMGVRVEEYTCASEDGGGPDPTDLVAPPFQTN